jgi:predicted Zn finger-like uncharacterized protein
MAEKPDKTDIWGAPIRLPPHQFKLHSSETPQADPADPVEPVEPVDSTELACPSCEQRFRVDNAALGPVGRMVRCSQCHHAWWVLPPDPDSAEDRPPETPEPAPEEVTPAPEPRGEEAVADTAPQDSGGEPQPQTRSKRRSGVVPAILLAFVAVALVGGFLVGRNFIARMDEPQRPAAIAQQPAEEPSGLQALETGQPSETGEIPQADQPQEAATPPQTDPASDVEPAAQASEAPGEQQTQPSESDGTSGTASATPEPTPPEVLAPDATAAETSEPITPEAVTPEAMAAEAAEAALVAAALEETTAEAVTPEMAAPEELAPEVTAAEAAIPEVAAPEETAVEAVTPEMAAPEELAPEVTAAETAISEAAALEETAVEAVTPEMAAPEELAPEATAAETAIPEAAALEETAVEAVTPELAAPEELAPEATAAEAVMPETVASETGIPETASLEPPTEAVQAPTPSDPTQEQVALTPGPAPLSRADEQEATTDSDAGQIDTAVDTTGVEPSDAPPPTDLPVTEEVIVRAGRHESFARIVFDWPQEVTYETRQDGDRLVVSFSRPAIFDVTAVEAQLGGYVGPPEISQDLASVTFPLVDDFDIETFALDSRVVFDFRFASEQ